MKNILLLIDDDDGQEARIQVALDVTRAMGSHIICLDMTTISGYGRASGGDPADPPNDEPCVEAGNKARVMARLKGAGVSFDWIGRAGCVARSIEGRVGLCDLVVLSSDSHGRLVPRMANILGGLSITFGKPFLVVPPSAHSLKLEGRAMVAWDGSRDAEAALLAARPLLQQAEAVTLFCVDDGFTKLPVQDAAYYLSRYNMHPIKKCRPVGFSRPGAIILKELSGGRYDYAVMGAYSRDPAVEAIFGGTTRTMLKKSPVPIFLVHHARGFDCGAQTSAAVR